MSAKLDKTTIKVMIKLTGMFLKQIDKSNKRYWAKHKTSSQESDFYSNVTTKATELKTKLEELLVNFKE